MSAASSQSSLRPVTRVLALSCALAVWFLGLLAVDSHRHAELHADAGHENHSCAVTLFSQGAEPVATDLTLVVVPELPVTGRLLSENFVSSETAVDWLLPARGPPSFAEFLG